MVTVVEEKAKIRSRVQLKLPKIWTDVVGILKNKKIDSLKYQKQVRSEWSKRLKKS